MSEKIKITEEELNTVRTVQTKFQDVRFQFGGLYIEKLAVDAAIKAITDKEGQLQEEWKSLQKQENDIIEAILKKYGEGSLDVKEGVFIPETPKAS
jgi:predicted transcriptional regulator